MTTEPTRKGWIAPVLMLAALAGMALVPRFVESPYLIHILILVLLNTALGAAWNILGGYTGQDSLGHAAYFGVGAYVTMLLMQKVQMAPWAGIWLGAVAAVAVALVIGTICFRLRGPYFVLASIAVTEIIRLAVTNLKDWTNGAEGILVTDIPPLKLGERILTDWVSKVPFYYVALALAALTVVVSHLVVRSKLGFYFQAIREDQDAAHSLGINLPLFKNLSLSISAFLTALAGAFYGVYVGFIDPHTVLGIDLSVQIVLVVIIGGIGTLLGPLVGACVLVPLSEVLRSNAIPELLISRGLVDENGALGTFLKGHLAHAHVLVYGILVVLVILFLPDGLVGFGRKVFRKLAKGVSR